MEKEPLIYPSADESILTSDGELSATGFITSGTNGGNSTRKKGAKNVFQAFQSLLKWNKSDDGQLRTSTAFLIMVAMSYGSAVIILPFTLQQLGPLLWVFFTIGCFLILTFSAVLLKESCVHIILSRKKDITRSLIVQRPYPTIAEYAVGKRFSKIVEATMYVALVAQVLSFALLAATSMNKVIPFLLNTDDRTRIWLLIGFFITIPFMMVGTYSDLTMPTFIAVFTSFLASTCVLIVSLVAQYSYGVKYSADDVDLVKEEHIFKIFGEILFAATGPALLLPNLIVLLKKPEKFQAPILYSHFFVFFVYTVLAVVPFLIFGKHVDASILDTLHEVVIKLKMSPVWVSIITLASILLAIHFTMVTVLCANPIFLSLENKFNIPTGKYL